MNFPKVAKATRLGGWGALRLRRGPGRHTVPRVLAEAYVQTLRIQGAILHVMVGPGPLEFLTTPGKVGVGKTVFKMPPEWWRVEVCLH